MDRAITDKLIEWRDKTPRMPLILRGARQVGKTYSLKFFGNNYFTKSHYFNFEKDSQLNTIFDRDLDPVRIRNELSIFAGEPIKPEHLVILDEIGECPRALTSLKYFCEEMPGQAICAAGSLLGVKHKNTGSYPVGKVINLDLYPLNFSEFCTALEDNNALDLLNRINTDDFASIEYIAPVLHKKMMELWRSYLVTGGLPEIVQIFLKHKAELLTACTKVRERQQELIENYLADIGKHSGRLNSLHLESVFKSITSQLSQENKRYYFKNAIPGKKGFESMRAPLDWLSGAGLVLKTMIANKCEIPLSAFTKENCFKLYFFDVGLLGALSDISPGSILKADYGQFKGPFAENFIATEFTAAGDKALYCWQEKTAEIEFVRQIKNDLIPIEVKSGINLKAKSLSVFINRYSPAGAFLLSGDNILNKKENKVTFLPLYLGGQLKN